jgi:tetratricopeptide (TPR) repeat protein
MKNTPRIASVDKTDKSTQIDRIIGDIMRQRKAGLDPDDSAIERQHPELLPELGQRLHTLRALEAAARQARQESSGASPVGGSTPFEEDLDFLRRTLVSYEILGPVNYGGQGVVYKAIQRSTHRPVAIKVLLDGPLAPEGRRHRFAREVELISRLQHPNIVTVYESGVLRGRGYFAMEYVEGLPIDDYVLLHGLPVADVVRLFVTVCRAVSHAHQHGIIHRDLNPANILVDLEGAPHILDFGLAKDIWTEGAAHDRSFLTMPGQVVGTLPYLSPEQAGAQDREVDVRSDIYSLAVVLFELLTSGFPYPVDGDPMAVRDVIVSQEPLRLRQAISPDCAARRSAGASIIRDLEMVLLKALSKDKAHRYQSAAAFADDLERCLAGEVVEARAENRFYLLHRTFRKHRTAVAVAALFLLLLNVSIVVVTTMWLQVRAERDNARDATLAFGDLFDMNLTEIEESVRPLAGGVAVRDRLIHGLSDRIPELERLVEADETLDPVRTRLLEKQGDIAYEQGQRREAAGYYAAFLDRAWKQANGDPPDANTSDDVIRAYRKLAEVSDDPTSVFERGIEAGQELLARDHGGPETRYELGRLHQAFAEVLRNSSDYGRALQQLENALALCPPVDADASSDLRWLRLDARLLSEQGLTLQKLGDGLRAREAVERALRLRERIVAQNPSDVEARHLLLRSYRHLATLHADSGNVEQAKQLFRTAAEEGRLLARIDPAATQWDRDRYCVLERLSVLCLETGENKEADELCGEALSLAKRGAEVSEASSDALDTLGLALLLQGRIHMSKEAWEDAYRTFEEAADAHESLLASDPENLEQSKRLANAHYWLGSCGRRLSGIQSALPHYERTHDIYVDLAQRQPDAIESALDLVAARINLAAAYMRLESVDADEKAADLLRRAEQSLKRLSDAGKLGSYERWYTDCLRAICANQHVLQKRAEQRADTPLPMTSADRSNHR